MPTEPGFRTMANAAPVLIWVADATTACTFFNQQWLDFTGKSLAAEIGDGWAEGVHPEDLDACLAIYLGSFAERKPFEMEYRLRHNSGSYRWLLDRGAPHYNAAGEFDGYIGSCIDITERREAEWSVRFLADAGSRLSASLDYPAALQTLADQAVAGFADWSAVTMTEDLAEGPGLIRFAHRDPSQLAKIANVMAFREGEPKFLRSVAPVLKTGKPVLLANLADGDLRRSARSEAHYQAIVTAGARSAIVAPLIARDRTAGALMLVRGEGSAPFTGRDLAIATEFANRGALALDNARLYSGAQRANDALQLLADAGTELSTSLDLDEALANFGRLIVPRFADICTVDLIEPDGTLRRPVLAHVNPEKAAVAEELRRRYPPPERPDSDELRRLIRGEPQFFPVVTDEMLQAGARDEWHLAALRKMAPVSAIIVPLVAHGRTFGALSFISSDSGRHFDETDYDIGRQLGRRAALSIDNGRLYASAQEIEARLLETNDALRRANDAKDEFLGMMSHELRTPLTVINGGARILRARSGQLEESAKDSIISDIEQESDRLFRMVENLLAMAHLDFTEEVSLEPVLAQRLVERVVEAFNRRRPDRKVIITTQGEIPPLCAEATYLEQIVRNLLSNADKYSPAGPPIEVTLRREGAEAAVTVKDRGVGIAADEAEMIFQRFYRSERTARLIGGSGVGLALCRRLLEAMSGHIWAQPREGGGLEVTFTLPVYEEVDA
ncbi:MAG: GAF domain-containing protein [Chloroflexi bacterium]|nr:GAF domain-containing protein [Chloroflexota bacterium]